MVASPSEIVHAFVARLGEDLNVKHLVTFNCCLWFAVECENPGAKWLYSQQNCMYMNDHMYKL